LFKSDVDADGSDGSAGPFERVVECLSPRSVSRRNPSRRKGAIDGPVSVGLPCVADVMLMRRASTYAPRRFRQRKKNSAASAPRAARPPTTPPTIAPVEIELLGGGVLPSSLLPAEADGDALGVEVVFEPAEDPELEDDGDDDGVEDDKI